MRMALEFGVADRPARPRWMMRCCVLEAPGIVRLEERLVPQAGPREAIVQVKLASLCAADCMVARGEYPVRPGLILGHEGVGVIHELGAQVPGFELGDRVRIHAMPRSAAGNGSEAWCLGHTLDGTQAEFVRVPDAESFLEALPSFISDMEILTSLELSRDARRRFLFEELEIAYRLLLPRTGRCPKALVEIG